MTIYGKTDTGIRRRNNEDSLFYSCAPVGIFDALMIVCDGMGGHSYGEIASETACRTIVDVIREAPMDNPGFIMDQAISIANLEVRKKSEELRSFGMGTTCVLVGLIQHHVYVGNVGDSRLYVVNSIENSITQITRDHSYVEEMVEKGLIERGSEIYESQKNVITRAIGIYSEVETDEFDFELQEGDILLLCTDGLTNMVEDRMIKALTLDDSFPLEKRVDTLISVANSHGGKDNITVILCREEEERHD